MGTKRKFKICQYLARPKQGNLCAKRKTPCSDDTCTDDSCKLKEKHDKVEICNEKDAKKKKCLIKKPHLSKKYKQKQIVIAKEEKQELHQKKKDDAKEAKIEKEDEHYMKKCKAKQQKLLSKKLKKEVRHKGKLEKKRKRKEKKKKKKQAKKTKKGHIEIPEYMEGENPPQRNGLVFCCNEFILRQRLGSETLVPSCPLHRALNKTLTRF